MASTGITWSNFVVNNDGIKDFRELIKLATLEGGDLMQFVTFMPNTYNGDKLDGIGQFSEVGLAGGTTCAPTFNASAGTSVEKTWVLGEWEVPEKICYKDLDATAARYALKSGTEIADMTGTDVVNILEPVMSDALNRMFWRLTWFGNTAAALASGGGTITAGKNVNLFKTCDGFFKRFATLYTATAARKTAIAANAQGTYSQQFSAFTDVLSVLDGLIFNAPLKLRTATDKFILCTQSVADAFEKAMTNSGTLYTELAWKTAENGMQYFKYRGVDIYPIPLWDSYIQEYEDNGTKYNSPHRALYTTKSNLYIAAPGTDLVSTLQTWFSADDQDVKMLARDKFGTMNLDDTLFQMAI